MANEKIAAGVAKILAAAKSIRTRYATKKLTSLLTADRKAIEQGLLEIGDADVPVILTRINGVPVPTPNPPEPPAPSNFRNWPSMLVSWLQGNTTNGADTTAGRQAIAKTDITVLQYKWTSGRSQDYTNIQAIKAIRSGVILGSYADVRMWTSAAESQPDDFTRWVYDVVAAGPGGASGSWRLKDVSGTGLRHRFNPSDMRATNMAVTLSGTNAGGKRMSEALAQKFYDDLADVSGDRRSIYNCIGFDDYNIIDDPKYSDSSTAVADYEQNGVSDATLDNTASGGGFKFRTGMVQNLTDWRTRFPGWVIFANTDLALPYLQGTTPPRPITSNEMYRKADIWLTENPYAYRFRIGDGSNANYPLGAAITLNEGWVQLIQYQQFSKSDAESPLGKRCFAVYEQLAVSSSAGTPLASKHYDVARTMYAHIMSMEGGACALTYSGADRPFWLDEMAIKFGARISAGTMGTVDDSVAPVTVTLRSADYTGGGGEKFYWTEFANALVVFRWDLVSITPGSSNFGDGSAASCTLPSAGTGYRWDEFNASTYVHPDYSDLAMTGQNTALNSGATNITSVSLKPLHAKFFRRVAV